MIKRVAVALLLTVAGIVGFIPNSTKAAASGATFTISPFSFELFANPGESISEKLRVTNNSATQNSYQITVEDFKAQGEDGSVGLIDDGSNSTYSLAKWVIPEPKNFSLNAGATAEIPFSINVPKDAEPGGHYCSVLVSIGGGGSLSGSGATVQTRVGSLILLRVSGDVKEDASVASFTTDKNYYQGSPVSLDLRIKNNGNNHIAPKGSIVITNLFGQKVTEIPLNSANVLPDAIRKMITTWSFSSFLAGRYTATLVATYGDSNKPISASTSFIVFPKLLMYICIAIIVLILLIVLSKRKLKRILHNLTK